MSSSSAAISVIRGDNLVGLQPDDRMPNDWLRMVARVFAAYRLTPLETSIVAYIDGFHLSKESYTASEVVIGITDGQGFVDDQFIGFNNDPSIGETAPESTITVSLSAMGDANPIGSPATRIYSVVLCYTWVNIMPPQKPNFDVVLQTEIDPEHMLELGQLIKWNDGTIELIDDKRMWFWDLLQQFIGDTEIDGPGSARADSKELPYLITVKEDESIDVGWALDFHELAGEDAIDGPGGFPANHHNYDVRLSTYSDSNGADMVNGESKGDGKLYLNGGPILAAPQLAATNDLQDNTDKFGAYHSNLRIIDSSEARDGYYSTVSNSQYVNYELCTLHKGVSVPPPATPPVVPSSIDLSLYVNYAHGAKLSHYHAEHETHLINYYNFDCPTCIINDFKLGNQPFDVTINNKQILTYYDFPGGVPPELVFFIGKFPAEPLERYPKDSRYESVQDGDMYYNTIEHAYYFYEKDRWSIVGSNAPVRGSNSVFISSANQKGFPSTPGADEFAADPDFLIVSRAGLVATADETDDVGNVLEKHDYRLGWDGTKSYVNQIIFNEPCEADERINVYTVNVGPGNLPDFTISSTTFYNSSMISNGNKIVNQPHNPDFSMFLRDGNLLPTSQYTETDSSFTLDDATTGNVIQVIFIEETEGRLNLVTKEQTVTTAGSETISIGYNPDFLLVFIDGALAPSSRYNDTVPGSVEVYNTTVGNIIRIYTANDVEGVNNYHFYNYEIDNRSGTIFDVGGFDPQFTIASVSGVMLSPANGDYTMENGKLNLAVPIAIGDVLRFYSMGDSMGASATVAANNMNRASRSISSQARNLSYKSAEFVGDGTTIKFDIDGTFDEAPVHIDGIRVKPSEYRLTSTHTTTSVLFDTAPENGAWIMVDYIG